MFKLSYKCWTYIKLKKIYLFIEFLRCGDYLTLDLFSSTRKFVFNSDKQPTKPNYFAISREGEER